MVNFNNTQEQHPQTTEIQSQKLPFQNCLSLWCIQKFPNFDQFIIHAEENHPKLVTGLSNLDVRIKKFKNFRKSTLIIFQINSFPYYLYNVLVSGLLVCKFKWIRQSI